MSRVNGIDLLRARGAGRNRIPGPRRRHRRRHTTRRRRYTYTYLLPIIRIFIIVGPYVLYTFACRRYTHNIIQNDSPNMLTHTFSFNKELFPILEFLNIPQAHIFKLPI